MPSRRESQDIGELQEELERFQQSSRAAIGQLDWCIRYLADHGQRGVARVLKRNRDDIVRRLG